MFDFRRLFQKESDRRRPADKEDEIRDLAAYHGVSLERAEQLIEMQMRAAFEATAARRKIH
jgi:hypothetical protein